MRVKVFFGEKGLDGVRGALGSTPILLANETRGFVVVEVGEEAATTIRNLGFEVKDDRTTFDLEDPPGGFVGEK